MKKIKTMAVSFVSALAMACLLLTSLPTDVRAASGTGTEEDPVIAKTYEDLYGYLGRENYDNWDGELYIKLGADIESNDKTNDYNFRMYSSKYHEVHLDLAGHKLSRIARTTDTDMFDVNANSKLIIDDSVGGGSVVSNLDAGNVWTHTIGAHQGGQLEINGGSFTSLQEKHAYGEFVIFSYENGRIVINGGTFSGYHPLEQDDVY